MMAKKKSPQENTMTDSETDNAEVNTPSPGNDTENADGSPDRNQIVSAGNRKTMNLEAMVKSAREIAEMNEDRYLQATEHDKRKIIYQDMPEGRIANTFREIRTKMLALSQGKNFICMVTSVNSGGGASFVSMNLATAFSFEESKTSIVVDCNLRHPILDKMVDLEADQGLTDFLEENEIGIERIIYPSGIKRVRLIPVGQRRENVVEYFTSVRMKRFLDSLVSRYMDRFIFLDAPPIGDSVDARILAELCDFVILVVEYGKVTEKKLKTAVDAIGRDRLAGVVFNREPDLFHF